MKIYGKYKCHAALVLEMCPSKQAKRTVRELVNQLGVDWKVWAENKKEAAHRRNKVRARRNK